MKEKQSLSSLGILLPLSHWPPSVKNLGVIFDSVFFNKFKQIDSGVWTSFNHLHLLPKVKLFLNRPNLIRPIHAFSGSRLDYCSALYIGVSLLALSQFVLELFLVVHEQRRALRSSNQPLLQVPRSRCKRWGDRAFSVAAPWLWNELPHWHTINPSSKLI